MKPIRAFLVALMVVALCAIPARAATILPLAETTFLDQNGAPLAGGQVYFYVPNTLTPKATYQNAGGTVSNTNPVTLDGSGRAIIYGAGQYRQQVYDVNGNLIWDQLTADTSGGATYSWAGTSGGTAGAQTLSAPNFTLGDGQQIGFIAGFSNSGPLDVVVNGGSPISVIQAGAIGPQALGSVVAGNQYFLSYSATNGNFQISTLPAQSILPASPIVAAATTDIGTLASHNASISGSTTIVSFGSSASITSQFYFATFTGAPLITASSAISTPQGGNIQASPGASAFLAYLGNGAWQIISYNPPAGAAFGQAHLSVTNSTTLTLLPKGGSLVTIDGAAYALPSAGVSSVITSCYLNGVAAQTLTASTLYYAYLFNNSGTLAIDFSTTGHVTDTTPGNIGVEIKSGDSTRTLIGMVYPISGPALQQSTNNLYMLSWFNKSGLGSVSGFSTIRTSTSASFAEINTEIRNGFLIWAGDTAEIAINGYAFNSGAALIKTTIGIDSTTVGTDAVTYGAIPGSGSAVSVGSNLIASGLSEGVHFATLLGSTTAGTASWEGGVVSDRCSLQVGVRG